MSKVVDNFGNKRTPNPAPGAGFNSYAAGKKHYGAGRSMPNIGPVAHPKGYSERENKARARKVAMLKRLKAQGTGVVKGSKGGGLV